MNRFTISILGYVKFFLMYLVITFLFYKLWNWFQGDSLLQNAVIVTIAIMLVDWGRLLFKKLKR